MAKLLEYNATLTERVDITDALTLFRVTPDQPPAQQPWFTPGQYCVLGLNNVEKPELGSVRRSMSIASAPEDQGPVEFYIRWVAKPESDNPLTHLLWKIKTGDRVYMRAVAAGVFTVKDTVGADDPRLRVMVAAGTGSAPFPLGPLARRIVPRRPRLPRRAAPARRAPSPQVLGHRQPAQGGARLEGRHRPRRGVLRSVPARRPRAPARLAARRLRPQERRDLHLRSHRHDHRHDHPAARSRLRPRLQAYPRGARRPGRRQGLGVLRAVRHRAGDQHQGPQRRRAAARPHAGRPGEAVGLAEHGPASPLLVGDHIRLVACELLTSVTKLTV
ncbi:MAG: hypothetical protein E6J91_36635 [Deltaproteobacteria bacterium]|nr:MAG: hypothetical protein E6J91_36635 [Deltaproteobacteria bacterium]